MKKSLLAVAAMGAFAGAAQAQSSVTVYGILDVGYQGENTRVFNSNTTTNGGYTRGTYNQFGQSGQSTSRLGFRGTEDLGGGTSAFFTLEFGLNPTTTTMGAASSSSYGGLSNRQTFVGLAQKGIGNASIGTIYTPIHTAVAATDPGQANNIAGNVIYTSAVPTELSAASAGNNTIGYTVRTTNTLAVTSDTFGGFRFRGMYTMANATTSQTAATGTSTTSGGVNNYDGWGVGLDFTLNKLLLTANYQALKAVNPYNGIATAASGYTPGSVQIWTNAGAGGSAAGQPQNIQDNQAYIAGTYDFGILKAYAQYVNRKATSTPNSNYFAKRTAQQIGVRGNITKTIESWASVGNGRYTAFGDGAPTVNFNAWQLGTNYNLSKRTNLYAIYGQQITSTGAYTASTVGGTAAGRYSYGVSNYALGIRHTF
jgi:predicted porin